MSNLTIAFSIMLAAQGFYLERVVACKPRGVTDVNQYVFFFSFTFLKALGPELGQCIGIDISESMVEQYNAKAGSEVTQVHATSTPTALGRPAAHPMPSPMLPSPPPPFFFSFL